MIDFILRFAIGALALWAASTVLPGFKIRGVLSLLAATALLGIVNAVLLPVLKFITFPLTILTLGLFLVVLNGLMIVIVDKLLKGVEVKGFLNAMLAAVVVGLINWAGQSLLGL